MKKQLLAIGAIAFIGAGSIFGQRTVGSVVQPTGTKLPTHRTCGTQIPDDAWEQWFGQKVDEFKQNQLTGKTQVTSYTIPVIIHILHNGDAVGSGENIAASQVASQMTALNKDYAGTGPGTIPAVYQSVKAGNTGIQFCLALKDVNGNTLAEPGIERINWSTKGWTDPGTLTINNIQSYFDGTIKPASIWDATKYLNIWVADANNSGLLGYASFPAGSTLTGLSGVETSQTSGVVINFSGFGTTGTAQSPYNGGRTATHEIGHWLGLRHISGDASCGNDYCNDTPAQKGGYSGGQNGLNWGCPPTGWQGTGGLCSGNTTGQEMFMNFMDYPDDACLSMFTLDQSARIQTCMANGTYRKLLGTHSLCNSTALPPVANFTHPSTVCAGVAAAFTDASQNSPTTWSWSVTPNTGVTITTSTSQNPSITFTTPASYTVSLTATNAQGNNTTTQTVVVTNCTVSGCDTISQLLATDTLWVMRSNAQNPGYVAGNNGYDDREKGNYFSSAGLTSSQLTGGIVIFYRDATANKGTTGTANININVYNGNNTTGPAGAATMTHSVALSTITGLTPVQGVTYCGNPNLQYTTAVMYPYNFNFTTPQNITADFLMTVSLPVNSATDTAAIFMNGGHTLSAGVAWEKFSDNSWHPFTDATNSWGLQAALAILPKVNCPVGMNDVNALANNIALFPNPSNGNVNFVTTLTHANDLTFTVSNALGQQVYQKTEKNVSTTIINLDLTNKGKGLYIVTITNSNGEKAVKKIVIE